MKPKNVAKENVSDECPNLDWLAYLCIKFRVEIDFMLLCLLQQ